MRDHFAMAALPAVLSQIEKIEYPLRRDVANYYGLAEDANLYQISAASSYHMADAMLEVRKGKA